MDKLSLYDLLSFLVPGFLWAEALRYALWAGDWGSPWNEASLSEFEGGLIGLGISLLLGLVLNWIIYRAMRRRWIKRLLKKPALAIANDSKPLKEVLPQLCAFAQIPFDKLAEAKNEDADLRVDLFDHAYYYLEANGKIAAAKSYQSMYFFLRNLFMVALIMLPVYAAEVIWHAIKSCPAPTGLWTAAGLSAILLPLCVQAGRFCREKMVVRVLWTYYILKQDPAGASAKEKANNPASQINKTPEPMQDISTAAAGAERPRNPPRTLKEHKWYYAAYLNMARHNAYMIVKDMNVRLGLGSGPDDDAQTFAMPVFQRLQNGTPDLQRKIIRELHGQFRWLGAVMYAWTKPDKRNPSNEEIQKTEALPEDYFAFFRQFFRSLNSLRNACTHSVYQEVELPRELLFCLRSAYDAAVRVAKERFQFEEPQLTHLRRQDRNGREKSGFTYAFFDQVEGITDYGAAFFACLLLERKYANLFTHKIAGMKRAETRGFQATREVFAVQCVRLPNARHTSATPEGALLLDMLNELARCPQPLYPQLEKENQDQFRVPVAEGRAADIADEDGEDGFVLMKRHEDRFARFALRFMDESGWFKKLRFPVDLGNYHYHLYEKTVDGQPRIGSLWKKLIGWGRINGYEKTFVDGGLPDAWKALLIAPEGKDINRSVPYLPQTYPHYHLPQKENIPIRMMAQETADHWPTVREIQYETEKQKQASERQKPIDEKPLADLILSRHELAAMVWYGLLKGGDQLEIALEKHLKRRRKLYEDIASGKLAPLHFPSNLSRPDAEGKGAAEPEYLNRKETINGQLQAYDSRIEDLPDELKNYLLGVPTRSFEEKGTSRLDDLINDTARRQKSIKAQLQEKRRPGSSKDVRIKAGRLADFLSKDIMLFQPPDGSEGAKARGKATTMLYTVLQSKLALYGANADTLKRTFEECGLIGKQNPHPFLEAVANAGKRNIVDFYAHYLGKRLAYLEQCKAGKSYGQYHWLKNNQARQKGDADFAKKLAARLVELPVAVPRRFFTELIRAELASLNDEGLSKALKESVRQVKEKESAPNVSMMLKAFFEQCRNDKAQDFYEWPRSYKIFDSYADKRKRAFEQVDSKAYSEAQRKSMFSDLATWAKEQTDLEKKTGKGKFNGPPADYVNRFKEFETNEKDIREIRMQDMMTLLMCLTLMQHRDAGVIGQADDHIFLKEIAPKTDTGILGRLTTMKRDFKWSIEESKVKEQTGSTTIFQEGIKVKNIGDFNRFAKDRRIGGLLAFMQQPRLTRAEVELELYQYDDVRPEVFRVLQEFEQRIVSKVPGLTGISFKEIIEAAEEDEHRRNVVLCIRNAFSHNQYPSPILFPDLPVIRKDYAGYLLAQLKMFLTADETDVA